MKGPRFAADGDVASDAEVAGAVSVLPGRGTAVGSAASYGVINKTIAEFSSTDTGGPR
jgi:hypothetical protein